MSQPSRAPRRSSLAALAAVAALLAGALTGCSDDDGGVPTSEAAPGDPWAAACREVIDARDAALVARGREASLTLVAAVLQDEELSTDQLATVADDITALRDHLADTRAQLAAVEVDGATADDVAAWDDIVVSVDDLLGHLDVRIDAAQTGDLSSVQPGVGSTGVDVAAALGQLDLLGRDCEVVYDHRGHSDDERGFVEQASAACAAIVDRRRESGFDLDSTVVEALAEVMQDGAIADPDPVADALDTAMAEWTATRDDLAAVDAADAADPAAWDEVLALAEDRLDAAEVRAAALESGDADEIAAAFEPGALIDIPGFTTLPVLGLEHRDCGSIGN